MTCLVTKDTFPAVHAAFLEIELDNGGHLIGTVYPGPPIDLNNFTVPAAFADLVPQAEAGLSRLRAVSEEDFSEFVCGEETAAAEIQRRQGDLDQAHDLLELYFNGWSRDRFEVAHPRATMTEAQFEQHAAIAFRRTAQREGLTFGPITYQHAPDYWYATAAAINDGVLCDEPECPHYGCKREKDLCHRCKPAAYQPKA